MSRCPNDGFWLSIEEEEDDYDEYDAYMQDCDQDCYSCYYGCQDTGECSLVNPEPEPPTEIVPCGYCNQNVLPSLDSNFRQCELCLHMIHDPDGKVKICPYCKHDHEKSIAIHHSYEILVKSCRSELFQIAHGKLIGVWKDEI